MNKFEDSAFIYDIDDTIEEREWYTRVGGTISGLVRPHHLPDVTLDEIAAIEMNHAPVDDPISSLKERISFEFHAHRLPSPRFYAEVRELTDKGATLYIVTGRPNGQEWTDMTEENLGKVRPYIAGIDYTPRGIKTAISKVHAIYRIKQRHPNVTIDEDDPRTAEFEALMFPDANIIYRRYRTTARLESKQFSTYTNIKPTPPRR